MHLETHALEDDLCTAGVRHLLENGGHLGVIQCRRGEQDIELSRKKPQRRDIELTSLQRMLETSRRV